MRFQKTIAFTSALAAGTLIGACNIPQPEFECNALPPFWASYELQTGEGSGTCATLPGDLVNMQRYFPPGAKEATMAVLTRRMGRNRQLIHKDDGTFARVDPNDPEFKKESAIGKFASILPDNKGVCSFSSATPGEQEYPEVMLRNADGSDGGILPALDVTYDWSNVKILSTAQFPGTLFVGDLHLTENACDATYKVYGVHPIVPCETDEDCNPEPNLAVGRVTGSGMSADYAPKCKLYPDGTPNTLRAIPNTSGVCFPSVPFDQLAK